MTTEMPPRKVTLLRCGKCKHVQRRLVQQSLYETCVKCFADDVFPVEFVEASGIVANGSTREVVCLNCLHHSPKQSATLKLCGQCYSNQLFVVDADETNKNERKGIIQGRIVFWLAWALILTAPFVKFFVWDIFFGG